MSAVMRYQKLQRKVIALEAAGLAGCEEHRLARATMLEVIPHMSEFEKGGLGLLGSTEQGEAKIAESQAIPGVDADMPKIAESKKARGGKKAKEAGEQVTASATVSDKETAADDPATANH